MPVAIVDELEVIEVDERQRQRRAAALRRADQPGHHRIEIAPVEKLRQRIVHRLDGELRLQRLDLDHLVLQIRIESRELLVQPLHFEALRERAVALGARVRELVLDAQQVVLGARAMRQTLRLRDRAVSARTRTPPRNRALRAWRSASRDHALHSPGR